VTARVGLIIPSPNRMVEPVRRSRLAAVSARTIGERSNERLETTLGRRVLVRRNPVPSRRSAFADDGVSLPRCQKLSASAYSLTIAVPGEGFAVTRGEPVIGGMHGPHRQLYCPRCKNWMFTHPQGMDFFVNVRATCWITTHGSYRSSRSTPRKSCHGRRRHLRCTALPRSRTFKDTRRWLSPSRAEARARPDNRRQSLF
jgi:hypothetical protein